MACNGDTFTHLSSVAQENKLSDGSGNVGVCENPQTGAGAGAVAGAGKKPVCVKAALHLLGLLREQSMENLLLWQPGWFNTHAAYS